MRASARLLCSSNQSHDSATVAVYALLDEPHRRVAFVNAYNAAIDKTKLNAPNQLSTREEDELYEPFQRGAFSGYCQYNDKRLDTSAAPLYLLQDQLNSFVPLTAPITCDVYIDATIYLLQRIEYANLYHTFTEWFNAYIVLRVLGIRHAQFVAFDARRPGALDDVWARLFTFSDTLVRFSSYSGRLLCFRHIIFGAPGSGDIACPHTPALPCSHVLQVRIQQRIQQRIQR